MNWLRSRSTQAPPISKPNSSRNGTMSLRHRSTHSSSSPSRTVYVRNCVVLGIAGHLLSNQELPAKPSPRSTEHGGLPAESTDSTVRHAAPANRVDIKYGFQ